MSRKSLVVSIVSVAIAGLTLVLAWHLMPLLVSELAGFRAEPRTVTARGDLADDERSTIELFENAKGSVVYITTKQRVVSPWTRNALEVARGTGSGFIWDNRGHVVTNHHVIDGSSSATVRLADGRAFTALLVGSNSAHDIAVVRITPAAARLVPLPIGTTRDLRVGQKAFAIGNPYGLDWTLTTGVVSALNRELSTESGATMHGLIQTDAAINPGNSGGPLLDSAGRLIGMNTAIYSPSGSFAGIGFAVTVDTVNRVVPRLIATGRYVRPSLGIRVEEQINMALSARLGIEGVFVLEVEAGSAAASAGIRPINITREGELQAGDVIVAVQEHATKKVADLLYALEQFEPGAKITLSLRRDDERVQIQVTLQASSESQ
jgi:S1-C subfamily serine protease